MIDNPISKSRCMYCSSFGSLIINLLSGNGVYVKEDSSLRSLFNSSSMFSSNFITHDKFVLFFLAFLNANSMFSAEHTFWCSSYKFS